ncbi:alpha/beta hydrolase [Lichenihabitans psoromatis]|uniref:alpha/beta hydrolase n=1 Tax=Lichenihabitans psoromatis TaxID=2528642 RepID=UPI001038340D|nr:alpha/beta hydrolase [Lichenihabitans psoromatis]
MNETVPSVVTVSSQDHKSAPRRIAVRRRPAAPSGETRPDVIWMGGFMSDMQSGKALAIDRWAGEHGRGFVRFDYSGHGESSGDFVDGTIGQWLDDALAVVRASTDGPQIIVGSSMGAWIAMLVARALAAAGETDRLAGAVLIAPAIDFTETLMWDRLTPDIREQIESDGVWYRPSPYGETPYPITRALIEDGRRHLLLGSNVEAHCPVHILQGMQDSDVPWQHALTLVEHLAADPVSITLVRDGDHRLSRDEDLVRLIAAIEQIA